MQTREQVKNWKVIGSLAAVAALGVSGLTVANASEPTDAPPPIEIDDQRSLDATVSPGTTTPSFVIVPAPSMSMDDSLDSPLASGDLDSVDDAPAAGDSVDSLDSPAPAPAPTVAEDSVDSVDSPAPAPSNDSVDSADSGDSLDSLDT